MVFHTVPRFVQKLFPERIWRLEPGDNQIYLTFDDGPVPGATDYVLNELAKRGQQATFFVVGDNVRKFSSLANEVLQAGNTLGNHTYHHLNGWNTTLKEYLKDVNDCDRVLRDELGFATEIFRPPYGLLKPSQAQKISQTHQIIMWNVLSGDYVPGVGEHKIGEVLKRNTKRGAIFLFHDQQKTAGKLRGFLPDFLDFIKDSGWKTSLLG